MIPTSPLPFQPADTASVLAFVSIVMLVVLLALAGAWKALTRRGFVGFGVGLLLWLGLFSGVVASGIIENGTLDGLPVPPIVLIFGTMNVVSLLAGLSPLGKRLAEGLPVWALVGFQAFRLPLELVLHAWANQGTIPVTMTWSLGEGGRNLDILSGILALGAMIVLHRAPEQRRVAWVANLVGLGLLANVGRVAVLSSPVPFGWGVEPPLMLIAHLPYAYIGPVCVGGALCGHVILTRKLLGLGRGV